MKLFACTVECFNQCYVETFLVVAENAGRVDALMAAEREKEHGETHFRYVGKPKEVYVAVSETREKVMSVWFGHNEDQNDMFGDDC